MAEQAPKKPLNFEQQIRVLYPGRTVPVGKDLSVKVFPVGVAQLREFAAALQNGMYALMQSLGPDVLERPGLGAPEGTPASISWEGVARLVPGLVGVMTRDLFTLVARCTSPSIELVPHWHLADILSAWIEENFDEERKIRPWVAAMERTLEMMTGERVDLWSKLSTALSREAIASMQSSIVASLASRTTGGQLPSSESIAGQRPGQTSESSQSLPQPSPSPSPPGQELPSVLT